MHQNIHQALQKNQYGVEHTSTGFQHPHQQEHHHQHHHHSQQSAFKITSAAKKQLPMMQDAQQQDRTANPPQYQEPTVATTDNQQDIVTQTLMSLSTLLQGTNQSSPHNDSTLAFLGLIQQQMNLVIKQQQQQQEMNMKAQQQLQEQALKIIQQQCQALLQPPVSHQAPSTLSSSSSTQPSLLPLHGNEQFVAEDRSSIPGPSSDNALHSLPGQTLPSQTPSPTYPITRSVHLPTTTSASNIGGQQKEKKHKSTSLVKALYKMDDKAGEALKKSENLFVNSSITPGVPLMYHAIPQGKKS
jgi:hypothetical protein